ncbi:hypothetical protein BJ138DRAFT_1115193 [Hygrophoropsis aurantiaca]|uniref:Uncharacterized protein n=1 Tax=Hygrophoropsis aurantiaca TaxID=72124 RepID=A0ACB8A809_9AGAM|nr:hypothetical protein BJ138DRAFT_1115193 [Hygrophoropsis aurantiaca]
MDAQFEAARNISYAASAALAAMVFDFALTVRDERRYIWSWRTSPHAKTYIVTRYFGILAQIANVAFTIWLSSKTDIAPKLCKTWVAYQATVIQILILVVDGLLILAIYAVFYQRYLIIGVAVALAAAQPSSMVISFLAVASDVSNAPGCLLRHAHFGSIYFGRVLVTCNPGLNLNRYLNRTTTLATHVVILFLFLWKFFIERRTRTPLRCVIMRDSTLAVTCTSVIFLLVLLCSAGVIKSGVNTNMIYYWLLSTLWVAAGRIILSSERLKSDHASGGPTNENSVGVTTTEIFIPEDASVYELTLNANCSTCPPTPSVADQSMSESQSRNDAGIGA